MRILVIGLFDSVHFARWLSQFENSNCKIWIFPSKKFKHLHPDLISLLWKNGSNLICPELNSKFYFPFYGYIDFMFQKIGCRFKSYSRSSRLIRVLSGESFDIIHAIEIQGAGYLLDSISKEISKDVKTIVTNYGSDIAFFEHDLDHQLRIRSLLSWIQYYSAECKRDYALATKHGFKGIFLPCIPNAGGFPMKLLETQKMLASERDLILVKSIGGTFGLGGVAIEAVSEFIHSHPEFEVFFYAVTPDLLNEINLLKRQFPGRVDFSLRSKGLSRPDLLEKFSKARVYIGCSASDGISTSFLEAIVQGAYPIQTNTSCAGEWVDKGFAASTPNPSASEILTELTRTLSPNFVNSAQEKNLKLAMEYLAFDVVQATAKSFYHLN
jgi:hypothetical protein